MNHLGHNLQVDELNLKKGTGKRHQPPTALVLKMDENFSKRKRKDHLDIKG